MNLRSFHPSALISIICGVLVFSLFRFFITPGPWSGEERSKNPVTKDSTASNFDTPNFGASSFGDGCAILVFDESQDDRFIRESLALGGIEGVISESAQTVPVDDFGELKMIPLDSFRNEIEVFDPRDNGYAVKLSSFFVHDGKRFFFFPIKSISSNMAASLKKQLVSLLGEIPFTLGIIGYSRPVFWNFILLAATCGAALYFSRSKRVFIFGLPVLLAFGWIGSPAFVLAAILSGISELLREPLYELSRPAPGLFGFAGKTFAAYRERLKPFRVNVLLILVFLFFFAAYSIARAIHPIPLIAGVGCFFVLCFLAFKTEADRARQNKHILFTPLPLLPLRARTYCFFPFLVPFCAGAVLALILPVVFPALSPSGGEISALSIGRQHNDPVLPDTKYLISTEDYNRNIYFQSSFSYRSLDQNQGQGLSPISGRKDPESEDYLRYYLGEDGLIAGGMNYPVRNGEDLTREYGPEYPPFPLEKLMDFLLHYNILAGGEGQEIAAPGYPKAAGQDRLSSPAMIKEWISVAIIMTVCLLDFFRPGIRGRKMKNNPIFWDTRIAA